VRLTLNFSPEKPAGYIYIQRGRVLHAEWGERKGEEAFHALLKQPDSTLALQDWNEPVAQTILAAWEHLLLESARQLDNDADAAEMIQAPVESVPMAQPLPPALADPFIDFWKVAELPSPK